MPLISVVIPAYNAGKYIAQALHSLIAQTFTDWECLVVNDGSTDDTLSVIERYATKESRILYTTIENSGSAKIPRDTAISMASSDWIVPLDADDTLDPEALRKLRDRHLNTNADVVLLRMVITDMHGNVQNSSIPNSSFDMDQILDGKGAVAQTIGQWNINVNGGLIFKNLFNTRQPIKNYMNADEYDTRQILLAAHKIAFVEATYYYRKHGNSITHAFSAKFFDTVHTNRLLSDLVEQVFGKDSTLATIAKKQEFDNLVNKRILLLRNEKSLTKEEFRKIKQAVKANYHKIPDRNKIDKDNLLKRLLLTSNYTTFVVATYIRSFIKA